MTIEQMIEQLVRRVVHEELAAQAAKPAAQHVTVADYAKTWSIGGSTVRRAIREGRLPAIHIGRAVRIPADVEIGKRSGARGPDSAMMARVERRLGITGRR